MVGLPLSRSPGTTPVVASGTVTVEVVTPPESKAIPTIASGATELDAVADQLWGDRAGKLRDPFGHVWMIMTHQEDVTPEEMQSRFEALMAGGG